jgi:hypothetical protein
MTSQILLAVFLFDSSAAQDYKGWDAEGLAKEAKVCFNPFFFASSAPPSSTVPGSQ